MEHYFDELTSTRDKIPYQKHLKTTLTKQSKLSNLQNQTYKQTLFQEISKEINC